MTVRTVTSVRGEPSATAPLTNARTRIVGTRTGFLADVVVLLVRAWRVVRVWLLAAWHAVSGVVTPLGWSMLALTALAFGLGYGLGWAEAVAVAWAGTVVVLVAALFLMGGHSHELTLEMPHNRVVVGEPAVGALAARNPTSHRLLGTSVEVPVGGGLLDLAVPSLGEAQRRTSRSRFPPRVAA